MSDSRSAKQMGKDNVESHLMVHSGAQWVAVDLVNDPSIKLEQVLAILGDQLAQLRNERDQAMMVGRVEGHRSDLEKTTYKYHTIKRELIRREQGRGRKDVQEAMMFMEAAMEMLSDDQLDAIEARVESMKKARSVQGAA